MRARYSGAQKFLCLLLPNGDAKRSFHPAQDLCGCAVGFFYGQRMVRTAQRNGKRYAFFAGAELSAAINIKKHDIFDQRNTGRAHRILDFADGDMFLADKREIPCDRRKFRERMVRFLPA